MSDFSYFRTKHDKACDDLDQAEAELLLAAEHLRDALEAPQPIYLMALVAYERALSARAEAREAEACLRQAVVTREARHPR